MGSRGNWLINTDYGELNTYAFSNYLVRKRSKSMYFEEIKKIYGYIEKTKEDNRSTEDTEKILKEAKALAEEHQYSAARRLLKKIDMSNENKEIE